MTNHSKQSSNDVEKEPRPAPLVSIIAPSLKLLEKMRGTLTALDQLGIGYKVSIVAAHRAPNKTLKYIQGLESLGAEVIIASGAGSAHLPGMVASLTTIPVIGVPLQGESLDGTDSLFSMLQMPPGVPVGVIGIDSAYNAGIFASQILSLKYPHIRERLKEHKQRLEREVEAEDLQFNSGRLKSSEP